MAKEFSKYEMSYIYDDVISYKGLEIHPVGMRDYLSFFYFAECFTLDKNSINDAKTISMTYMDYMYSINTDEFPYIAFFDAVLKIVTKNPDLKVIYARNKKNKPIFIVDGREYNSSDFDEIKKIICEYNMVDLPDDTIQKEIRDNMKKAQELRNKSSGKMASLEDQIVCVLISSSLSLEQIYSLSIRKFTKILERADLQLHYKVYLGASMSGMVEFKDKSFIKHWMSDLTKNKLDLVPFEQIKDTMSGKPSAARNKTGGRGKK
jgi:hypothetical protein